MKNQELAFRRSEGNKWFLRNLKKIEENSIEISLLCNWLMSSSLFRLYWAIEY